MTSTIINALSSSAQLDVTRKLTYFHFDSDDTERRKAHSMVRSLVVELSEQCYGICQPIEDLYKLSHSGLEEPSTQALMKTFAQIVDDSGATFIVVDALDECKDREYLFDIIEEMLNWKRRGLHVLLSSRTAEGAQPSLLDKACCVDLQNPLVDEDIDKYVRGRLQSDPQLGKWGLEKQIHEEISEIFREKSDTKYVSLPLNWTDNS